MKKRQILRLAVFVLALGVFVFSAVQLGKTLWERWKASAFYDRQQIVIVQRPTEGTQATQSGTESTETVATEPVETQPPVETAPITVDFDTLLAQCPDIIGWIYCEGTPISYPVVQGYDNDQYLYHLPDGSYNASGSIFADYRNGAVGEDDNLVIYGHHMKDNTMFASLTDYKHQEYYDAHPAIWFLTPEGDYKINLYAGISTHETGDVYNRNFSSESNMEWHMQSWQSQSTFVSTAEYEKGDTIVTLSTCTYEYSSARYVVIGVLEKLPAQ